MIKKIIRKFAIIISVIIICTGIWVAYIGTKIDIENLGVTNTPTATYIGIKETKVAMKDYKKVMSGAFAKLEEVSKNNPDVVFGKVFSLYQKSPSDNEDEYDLTMGYEIEEGLISTTEDGFVFGNRPSIAAMSFKVTGEYKYLIYGWSYSLIKTSISKEYKIDENEFSYESYEVSYPHNVDPDKFVTVINIPVTKK